jgi:hypothetical protein
MTAAALSKTEHLPEDMCKLAAEVAVAALTHPESRVRIQAGQTLGAMCAARGAAIFTEFAQSVIMTGIKDNLERDTTEALPTKLSEKLNKPKSKFDKVAIGKTAEEIFHESAGWKSLETSSKALLEVIKGCGASFVPYITQDLISTIFNSLGHTNRFVRETSYYLCCELAGLAHEAEPGAVPVASFDDQLVAKLAVGLADNWSQVRMAAAVASRRFLTTIDAAAQKVHFKVLLPALVLNRYYVAEGVRLCVTIPPLCSTCESCGPFFVCIAAYYSAQCAPMPCNFRHLVVLPPPLQPSHSVV